MKPAYIPYAVTYQHVLLNMGIQMPETCRDIYENKSQLLHQVGTNCYHLVQDIIRKLAERGIQVTGWTIQGSYPRRGTVRGGGSFPDGKAAEPSG